MRRAGHFLEHVARGHDQTAGEVEICAIEDITLDAVIGRCRKWKMTGQREYKTMQARPVGTMGHSLKEKTLNGAQPSDIHHGHVRLIEKIFAGQIALQRLGGVSRLALDFVLEIRVAEQAFEFVVNGKGPPGVMATQW